MAKQWKVILKRDKWLRELDRRYRRELARRNLRQRYAKQEERRNG